MVLLLCIVLRWKRREAKRGSCFKGEEKDEDTF
jgi:hypothetical protein